MIEEVGRHYGFDRLPIRFPVLSAAQAPPDPRIARDRLLRQALTSAGFSESMTFAFIERHAALPFCDPGTEPIAIANPLSEKFAVLRPSLLAGLTDSCAHNRRRGRRDVQLFEVGSRFTSEGEGRAVALAWTGAATARMSSASGLSTSSTRRGRSSSLSVFGQQVGFSPAERAHSARPGADVRSAGTMLAWLASYRRGSLRPGCRLREISVPRSIRTRSPGAAAMTCARSRCRVSAIVRDVSILGTKSCLPRPFVALSVRRSSDPARSVNSIGTG